uniref:Uncharacterized protein n=1 Tax=Alexandrium monilatum TaxID=311494 RepID=A0A7S4Q2S4_9DINO
MFATAVPACACADRSCRAAGFGHHRGAAAAAGVVHFAHGHTTEKVQEEVVEAREHKVRFWDHLSHEIIRAKEMLNNLIEKLFGMRRTMPKEAEDISEVIYFPAPHMDEPRRRRS